MGEDVVHYILALCIVVKKYGGQPIHLTVILPKQLFEFTLICHTLLIHTKIELLNLSWHFFCEISKKNVLEYFSRTLRDFNLPSCHLD